MDSPDETKLLQETKDREGELNVDSAGYFGLNEIAEQLGNIHNSLRSYNVNACDGELTFNVDLCSGRNNYPVKVQLTAGTDKKRCTVWIECEALDRMASAFERIATALERCAA